VPDALDGRGGVSPNAKGLATPALAAGVSEWGARMRHEGAGGESHCGDAHRFSPHSELAKAPGWAMLRHQLDARARRTRAEEQQPP